ncbi:MAG: Flagellar motor protein [Hydrocarboniphaga sp.]|uniref:flagellar motor protein n=1 Tax=Hydrocarboniphaga sp. TaxID=2033016 RepID=UPI00260A129C|nr:flagellar motor protein [Hydrocarboniphaga sp.]MDB5972112.1 Flagellar motor protein [Hydrocarboniphaga sp.]
MDILSCVSAVLAIVVLIVGTILKGANPMALLSPAAFVIVIIGTTSSVMMQMPMKSFIHGFKLGKWIFKPPRQNGPELIAKIVEWSNAARKQGLLALEASVETETDHFIKKGLQMLVDGAEPEVIRGTLEVDLSVSEHHDLAGAKVFEAFGIYAPTLGIIGAVMGLMAVMANLADPTKLGHGIAAAFVATIYGIGSANMFFLPMAAKLKSVIGDQTRVREMVIEGLIGISQGDNPRNIEVRLQGYLH